MLSLCEFLTFVPFQGIMLLFPILKPSPVNAFPWVSRRFSPRNVASENRMQGRQNSASFDNE